jgi:hypothetical protein
MMAVTTKRVRQGSIFFPTDDSAVSLSSSDGSYLHGDSR